MKQILVVLVLVAAGFGGYIYFSQPKQAPEVTFKDTAGNSLGWTALRGDKEHLLAVFLLPNCALSKYSIGLVNGLYGQFADRVAFVGIAFGDAASADHVKKTESIAFTVVGLRSTTDPYSGQEFFDMVRKSYGASSGIYGGTVVVMNTKNELLFGLAQEEVKELAGRLTDL